jgi:hypothetical protein
MNDSQLFFATEILFFLQNDKKKMSRHNLCQYDFMLEFHIQMCH